MHDAATCDRQRLIAIDDATPENGNMRCTSRARIVIAACWRIATTPIRPWCCRRKWYPTPLTKRWHATTACAPASFRCMMCIWFTALRPTAVTTGARIRCSLHARQLGVFERGAADNVMQSAGRGTWDYATRPIWLLRGRDVSVRNDVASVTTAAIAAGAGSATTFKRLVQASRGRGVMHSQPLAVSSMVQPAVAGATTLDDD